MAGRPSHSLERVFLFQAPRPFNPRPSRMAPGEERVELLTAGRGWIEHQGGWREVRAGDLVWNAPGDCTIGRSDPEAPYACLAATFRVRPLRGSGLPRFSHWPDPDEVGALARQVLRLFADETFDRRILGDYLYQRLRFQVELSQRRVRRQELAAPVRRVLELMERDYARSWTVPELARHAGWSAAHLHEAFRRSMGTPPHQWLLRRRLRAARERLLSGNDAVKSIAVDCGFADSAALAHAFQKHFGLSPQGYRLRQLRGGV